MSYRLRTLIILLFDITIVWTAIAISYLLRFDGNITNYYGKQMVIFALVATVVCGISLAFFSMYKRMWQYASVGEIIELCKAIFLGVASTYVISWVIYQEAVPLPIITRTLELMLLFMGGSRFLWRLIRVNRTSRNGNTINILVVGAGDCGALIAKEIMSNSFFKDKRLIGFIDDDPLKKSMQVIGLPILGNRHQIADIVQRFNVKDIIIAMPSVSKSEVSEIINICKLTSAQVQIIPAINDFVTGRLAVQTIRNVEVEDLLGREAIHMDLNEIKGYVANKVVLVTGAGGSIGSELSRQTASFNPEKLLLLGHGENSIYTIEMELRTKYPNVELVTIIADIQDRNRIDEVFRVYRPQVIFHAAAHKHVPLMERNPSEAVKNNVFGTKNVADSADRYKAERFVMISSDKAVNPSSVMGATKRIAEMYIQSMNAASSTQFVAVRFGNVLGSRGSVIPRFKEQIAAGGPVTVTHPDMVRYFMTIPEAVQLVIQAGALAKGGEVFILDMGKPVRIMDLAKDLIRLSGYEPGVDIDIEVTGMREGEKLYEELMTESEATTRTRHERIFIGKPLQLSHAELELKFKQFEKVLGEEQGAIRAMIERLVPIYSEVS